MVKLRNDGCPDRRTREYKYAMLCALMQLVNTKEDSK